jgi:hypothetical protein
MIEENMTQTEKRGDYDTLRELQHDSAESAAENDEGRGGLEDLTELSTLQRQAQIDCTRGDKIPAKLLLSIGFPQPVPASAAGTSWMLVPATLEECREAPERMSRRNAMIFSRTCWEDSRTMIFSPETRVRTVSGAFSTNLIRSELTIKGRRLRRVSWIMTVRTGRRVSTGKERDASQI